MKTPAYGPTEILRFPDGHCTIVTKQWWKKFLYELEKFPLTSTSTLRNPLIPEGNGTHGVAQVQ